ncbi:MAG: hypothetical protein JNK04_03615, partial [Myxococcales bacterium]|nr:hypothetical protein [Myxococcales bacterium]
MKSVDSFAVRLPCLATQIASLACLLFLTLLAGCVEESIDTSGETDSEVVGSAEQAANSQPQVSPPPAAERKLSAPVLPAAPKPGVFASIGDACTSTAECVASTGACSFCDPSQGNTCQLVAVGTECRASVGECDVAETCQAGDPVCPADAAAPVGAACGGAPSGACDAQDTCSGTVGATATCTA